MLGIAFFREWSRSFPLHAVRSPADFGRGPNANDEKAPTDSGRPQIKTPNSPIGGGSESVGKSTPVQKNITDALGEDIASVLDRLQAISEISDDTIFAAKLRQFHADFPQLQTDAFKDTSTQRALRARDHQGRLRGVTPADRSRNLQVASPTASAHGVSTTSY